MMAHIICASERIVAAFCVAVILGIAACSSRPVQADHGASRGLNQQRAVQLLAEQGYTHVSELHKRGSHWMGTADKGGQQVTFDLDKDGNAVDFILSRSVQ